MRKWCFAAALALWATQAFAQAGMVWDYTPSQPGVQFHDQPGLTYWVPYVGPLPFDSTCYITSQGTVEISAGFIAQVGARSDGTLHGMVFFAPDGRQFGFEAMVSGTEDPSIDPTLNLSIPLDSPVVIGLTHWPMIRFGLPGEPMTTLPLSSEAHSASTAFLADCATLTTAPPAVPGAPSVAWRYDAGGGAAGHLTYHRLDYPALEFEAWCRPGGQATIRMAAEAGSIPDGQAATVGINGPNGERFFIPGTLIDFREESGEAV